MLHGKVVTLPFGLVVTVIEEASPWTWKVIGDNEVEYEVIDRVLRELPDTFRRGEIYP